MPVEREPLEIDEKNTKEIEEKTIHPGINDEWSLYHINYATGENKYLTER